MTTISHTNAACDFATALPWPDGPEDVARKVVELPRGADPSELLKEIVQAPAARRGERWIYQGLQIAYRHDLLSGGHLELVDAPGLNEAA